MPTGYRRTFNDSFRCLEQLLPQLPVLQQIIYTGSCSIYGDAGGGWVDESTTAQPRDEHGTVLLEAERQLLAMANQQRRVCILRLGALYGPQRQFEQRFARLAGSTQPNRGERFTNWVHRDDAAAAAIAALDGHWQGIVNVVDDAPVPLDELLNASLAHSGLEPITWKPASEPGKPALNRRISNRLLKQRGFELSHPRIALLTGMAHPSANQHPHQSQHHHNGDDDIGNEHGTGCRLTHLKNLCQEPRCSHHPKGDQDD